MDRIFNNPLSPAILSKAQKNALKFEKKFRKPQKNIPLKLEPLKTLEGFLPILNLIQDKNENNPPLELPSKPLIVGNIRMGFGHYRIAIAICSAAIAKGYHPLWLDFASFHETHTGKTISHLNDLYSLGSKLSQKIELFNKIYWDKLNSEGFRKLDYNIKDQYMTKNFIEILSSLDPQIPFLGTHVWPTQAAIHAHFKKVINIIPDNWPMALHLAEGSLHAVQSPSAWAGYRTLRGMAPQILQPINPQDIVYTGHYIDHEIVSSLEQDCQNRLLRQKEKQPRRLLLSVGGAGAQKETFIGIIKNSLDLVEKGLATLWINFGDHKNLQKEIYESIPELQTKATFFEDQWDQEKEFAQNPKSKGIYTFLNKDIFAAVYLTNLLMRHCDFMITKPSELAFYPVPKIFTKRVGGHEAWGAIRSAELGDGTYEPENFEETWNLIQLAVHHDDFLQNMCESILRNHQQKIYHGAYKAIELCEVSQ